MSTVEVPLFALLVGINKYASASVPPLAGCVNDIDAVEQLLLARFGVPAEHICKLTDAAATRVAIDDAFRCRLIEPAKAHAQANPDSQPAIVLFHYSGHGSQALDPTGTKPNGRDETIVPHNSRTAGVFDIKDWELGLLIEELTRYTDNVTIVLDCCHSGSGTRDPQPGQVAARCCPMDQRPQPTGRPNIATSRTLGTDSGWMRPNRYVLLAACRDRELAHELQVRQGAGIRQHGAMSYFMVKDLAAAANTSRPLTYRELHERVRTEVNSLYDSQMPQCEGDRDRVVFGGARPRRDPFFSVVEKSRGYVWVDGGLAHQLTEGSLLHAYTPDTRTLQEAGAPIATLEVEEAGAVRSTCIVREGRQDLPLHSRVAVYRLNQGDFQRTASLDGEGEAVARLRARLAQEDVTPYVRLSAAGSPADFRVALHDGAFEIQDGSGKPIVAPVTTAELDDVAADLCHLVRYRNALQLQNKAPHSELAGSIVLSVRRLEFDPHTQAPQARPIEPTTGGEVEVEVGRPFVLEVTNNSAVPLYLGVFDFSYDWSISLLYPRPGEEQALDPGKTLSLGLSRKRAEQLAPHLPDDVAEVRQVVKVIASAQPTGYDALCQKALKLPFSSTKSADRAIRSPLTELLKLAMQGGQRRGALGPPPATAADEWTTAQTVFTLVRGAGEADQIQQLMGGQVMRDASEYRFLAGERRVTVRAAAPSGSATDPTKAGAGYRERCESFLGATAVSVSEPARTANGAEAVTVSATLPDGRLRAALLRFADGPLVELTLTTAPGDTGTEAEFARLLASAKPSAATPTQSVARGLATAAAGAAAHPAGSLVLDLTGYVANPDFVLESTDGAERYQFSRSAALEATPTRAGLVAPHLAGDMGSAVGADGRPVRFEVVPPRMFAKRATRTAPPVLESAVKGASGGPEGTTAAAVTGTVRGVALQVRLSGTGATPEKAEQLLQALRNAN